MKLFSFSKIGILLFGIAILSTSCEVLPFLQREYKPITKSTTTIYTYNEFSAIPAGPMDTEESVFGITNESSTNSGEIVNAEDQRRKRQQMVEKRMELARQEARKKIDEQTKTSAETPIIVNKIETTPEVAKPSKKEITKTPEKIVVSKPKTTQEPAIRVIDKTKKGTEPQRIVKETPKTVNSTLAKSKSVTTKKEPKVITEKPAIKKETIPNQKEVVAKAKKKNVFAKKEETMAVAAPKRKTAIKKEIPESYDVSTKKPGAADKDALVKKAKRNKNKKNRAAKNNTEKAEKIVENTSKPIPGAEIGKKGGDLQSILKKRKSLKEKGEEITAKKPKPKAEEPKVVVDKPKVTERSATRGTEVSVADIKIEKPVVPTASKVNPKLKPYFFPIEELKEAKAYRYIANGYEKDTSYKLMKTLVYGGNTILITEEYNKNFEIQKIIRESVTDNGVFVRDYTSYEVDGFGEVNRISCGVDEDESMKWDMNQGDDTKLKLNYHSSLYPNFNITMERKRSLVTEGEIVKFEGKEVKVITLKDAEVTTFTDHKDVQEERKAYTYTNKFAEGVGLVEYEVKQSGRATKVYALENILTYDEWNRLSRMRKPMKGN